jgi:Barstar (barnase inhibitor)
MEMMVQHKICVDFSKINSDDEFYENLSQSFGFTYPKSKNLNSVIDHLFGIRYPDEGMVSFFIETSDVILLEVSNISDASMKYVNALLHVIKGVNQKYIFKGELPAYYLLVI